MTDANTVRLQQGCAETSLGIRPTRKLLLTDGTNCKYILTVSYSLPRFHYRRAR